VNTFVRLPNDCEIFFYIGFGDFFHKLLEFVFKTADQKHCFANCFDNRPATSSLAPKFLKSIDFLLGPVNFANKNY